MPLINDRPFQMRASKEFLDKIDGWRRKQPDLPSRAEAIRRLVEQALGHDTMPPKHTARMASLKSEPPGMERDSRGHAIPIKERLPEDRAKAKRAKSKKVK